MPQLLPMLVLSPTHLQRHRLCDAIRDEEQHQSRAPVNPGFPAPVRKCVASTISSTSSRSISPRLSSPVILGSFRPVLYVRCVLWASQPPGPGQLGQGAETHGSVLQVPQGTCHLQVAGQTPLGTWGTGRVVEVGGAGMGTARDNIGTGSVSMP